METNYKAEDDGQDEEPEDLHFCHQHSMREVESKGYKFGDTVGVGNRSKLSTQVKEREPGGGLCDVSASIQRVF